MTKELHYTEEQLEALIRRPSAAEADDHLRVCPMCKSKHEFLMQFHEAFAEELVKPVDARIERLAQQRSANIIELKPYQASVDISQIGIGEKTLLLAAQHIEEDTARYVAVGTFASLEAKTLVRVVHDRMQGTYRIFVLAQDLDHMRHVLVVIRRTDGQTTRLVTDASGMSVLNVTDAPDWKNCLVLVYTPVASFKIDEQTNLKDINSGLIDCHEEGDTVVLSLTSEARGTINHVVFVRAKGKVELRTVVQGEPQSIDGPITEIRIFN
jgi:hypothetical protein